MEIILYLFFGWRFLCSVSSIIPSFPLHVLLQSYSIRRVEKMQGRHADLNWGRGAACILNIWKKGNEKIWLLALTGWSWVVRARAEKKGKGWGREDVHIQLFDFILEIAKCRYRFWHTLKHTLFSQGRWNLTKTSKKVLPEDADKVSNTSNASHKAAKRVPQYSGSSALLLELPSYQYRELWISC